MSDELVLIVSFIICIISLILVKIAIKYKDPRAPALLSWSVRVLVLAFLRLLCMYSLLYYLVLPVILDVAPQMTWKQVVDLNLDLDFTAVLSNEVVGSRMMLALLGCFSYGYVSSKDLLVAVGRLEDETHDRRVKF